MRRAAVMAGALAAAAIILPGCGGVKVPNVPNTIATVNGQAIPAGDYLAATSQRAGREVLGGMIEREIMLQWAKSEGVAPTDAQITAQIDALKRDGVYDEQVEYMGEDALKTELMSMQARMNIAKKLLKVSDKDIKMTYDAMKTRYVHGPRKQVILVINPEKAKIEEAAKKAKESTDFEKVATDFTGSQFAIRGPIKLWTDRPNLPKEITDTANKLKVGEVSKVIEIKGGGGPSQWAIMKVDKELPKSDLKLDDVKDEVTNFAAYQKSAMDPDFEKKYTEKKKDAKIKINIEDFEDVSKQFENPPQMGPMMAPQPGQ